MPRPTTQSSWLAALLLLLLAAAPPAAAAAPEEPAPSPLAAFGPGLGPLSDQPPEDAAGIFGRVTGERDPLRAVRVYAYQLADLSLHRVTTDERGSFGFPELPAGLYKIIAHKTGFVPAVVMLTRARRDAQQFLDLQLAAEDVEAGSAEDFWAVRDRIPADVLREIETPDAGLRLADSPFDRAPAIDAERFATRMEAMTGVEQAPAAGESLVTGGQVGVEGTMGGVRVGLSGDYWRLASGGGAPDSGVPLGSSEVGGLSRQIGLEVEGHDAVFALTTVGKRLVGSHDEPIDFETHRLSWAQDFERSRAYVAARYTAQTNYYTDGFLAPFQIPKDSRSWEVEGSYTVEATDRASVQGGLRYRNRDVGVANAEVFTGPSALRDERLDLFGRAGMRVQPAVLVEYGLYTTLRDGSISLVPHGGLVLQLGERWQASALASQKVSTEDDLGPNDFIPAFYGEASSCTQGEQSCYKLELSRRTEDGGGDFELAAVHRQVGETLRLFFNDDFFNHLEGLYLVEGDVLPELQLGLSHRIAPRVLARFESSAGAGGGGIFFAADRERYENSVRFLVTSLDTHFQGTDTGLFVSFHHLEQDLDPLSPERAAEGSEETLSRLEMQRLQLMLTQDLNILFDLASDWALKLNMEVSRGSALFGAPARTGEEDELRRRILGGFAVKF